MKKISIIFVLTLIVLSNCSSSFAIETLQTHPSLNSRTASSGSALTKDNLVLDKTADLKSRGDLEIQRRIEALNKLITKINSFKKLTDAQKSDLTTQVQNQINSLNSLKTKIDADTDITTLRTDVKSIITDYRIFVFFIEDINIIAASERISSVLLNISAVSDKLKTRIIQAQTDGKDVTSLNTLLANMQTKITDATTLTNSAMTEVASLSATGYPGNKTTLIDARTKIRNAYEDIKVAYSDGKQIIQSLISLGEKTESSTSSARNLLFPHK